MATLQPKASREEESFAEQAYRLLEEMIVTLELAPGALLSEAALSERLGMGRTPIREALQRLAADHLVQIMPRRGIRVSDINVEHQLLLIETRRELERLLASRAARRATPAERQRFAAMADAMEAAATENEEVAFIRLDQEFNAVVAECARNPFAAAAIAPLHAMSRRFWYIHYRAAADMPAAARLHADVMRAIATGDSAKAAEASDRLMAWIEAFTRATLTDRF
jgi:DNA-binding GntR family transcriptional regulator